MDDTVDFASADDPNRLEHLLTHIQDAVVEFRIDEDEPIVQAINPAFTDVFGYDSGEMKGNRSMNISSHHGLLTKRENSTSAPILAK